MYRLQQTDVLSKWLSRLKDRKAVARILVRLEALRLGNFGDAKSLGGKLFELRIHVGPGYRIYYARRSEHLVLLLVGGTKSRQSSDIERARKLLQEIE